MKRGAAYAASVAMWTAIVVSVLLVAVLVAFTRDPNAWRVPAAVLAFSCLGVCIWSAAVGAHSERDVKRAVDELARTRRLSK